ncbi:MAG: ERF family protein, partial [Rhodospirillaceae bacterium]
MASPSLAVVTKADTLAAALVRAQSAIGSAKKSSTNPHFKSRYADLTEVFAAALPALHENGIAVVQMPSANGPEVTVTTVLLHESGERLESSLTLTATQNTPQAIGSCITY